MLFSSDALMIDLQTACDYEHYSNKQTWLSHDPQRRSLALETPRQLVSETRYLVNSLYRTNLDFQPD